MIRARVTNGINGLQSTWRATHYAGRGRGLDIGFHEGETPRASRRPASYLLGKLARLDVLVLDDWGLAPVQDPERRDLLEILEDRYGTRSTIITSQLPPAQWHDYLADATLADAICDRLLHNAHRIVLKGPSRRKEAKLDD